MLSNSLLAMGCALIAYSPFVSLFSLIVYQKAQLVIVVTTAAFFYLLASLTASIVWKILHAIGLDGDGGIAAILPGVFFQFIFRCLFVGLYHKVEAVIHLSLEKEQQQIQQEQDNNNNDPNRNNAQGSDDEDDARTEADKLTWTEAAKLRLQLNDASCGVAAGVGYGGLHAILLYGTLLASEIGKGDNGGVLYQEFCPIMPSLAVSAIYCFCFTILDVFWMLFTFFGMRRRLMYHRGERAPEQITGVGGYLGNSRNGGNVALLLCLGTHLMASMFTLTNLFAYGCVFSLPLVAFVVLLTAYIFWAGVGRIYMPPMQGPGGAFDVRTTTTSGTVLQTYAAHTSPRTRRVTNGTGAPRSRSSSRGRSASNGSRGQQQQRDQQD